MPVFEYKCGKCGKISEFLEGSGRQVRRKCTYCGSEELTKQFSVFSAGIADGTSKKCFGCSDETCPHAGR